ncbi:MAG: acyl transferase, partial [Bacteroidota bacterium]
EQIIKNNEKFILLGVSFALLDFSEKYNLDLSSGIVMETGGMKGRRKELIREELHQLLMHSFNVSEIHSEYGMTELFSQAYSKGLGVYSCPPWMKILIRDSTDPKKYYNNNHSGCINCIDLANMYSCPFISTKDIGKMQGNNFFEVLGRMDQSDVRGCNLMVV